MALLKPKAAATTRTLSVRLPAELVAEVDRIKSEADAAGLVFDVADLVGRSLAGAVRQARTELPPPAANVSPAAVLRTDGGTALPGGDGA